MNATPSNPLLQQDSMLRNLVLDAASLSIKYHGMNEIIAMNNGENGMVIVYLFFGVSYKHGLNLYKPSN